LSAAKRTVIKTILIEARTPLAAGGFYSLRVYNLLLDNHISLTHLPHNRRRFRAMGVLLESAITMNTGLTSFRIGALHTHFVPNAIFIFFQDPAIQDGAAAYAASVQLSFMVRAAILTAHIRIEDRTSTLPQVLQRTGVT
jgi:hypothetical protein